MKIGLILTLALLPTVAAAQIPVTPTRDAVMAVVTREASAERARQKDLGRRTRRSRHAVSGLFIVAAQRLDAADAAATDTIDPGDSVETLYAPTGQPDALTPLHQGLDATLAGLAAASKRSAWGCAALVLTPAVYARMSVLTHDPKYLQAMDTAWDRISAMSWPNEPPHPRRLACGGDKVTDVNEDGAVIAGLARILEIMPADFPSRPRYVAQYQAMAAALITLQAPSGEWRPSLLDTAAFLPRQTSGTALATYALAFGLNHDLIDRRTYLPLVLRAWAGLNRDIGAQGYLDGSADTSGAFILAGLEIAKLDDPATPLPTPVVVQAVDGITQRMERPAGAVNTRYEAHPATPAVQTNPLTDDPSERSSIPMSSLPASRK